MKFDRRRFLVGSGGVLALPMLESLMPRTAFGQTPTPPKRLIILMHQDGRVVGNGIVENAVLNDWWSPAKTSGPLPTSGPLSKMLGALAPIRDEVVTIDGVDNVMRHTSSDIEGHTPALLTALTCKKPTGPTTAGGASFDYLLGQRLRSSTAQRASVVLPATAAEATWRLNNAPAFFGANGSSPTLIHPDPAQAIKELFGPPVTTAPPTPTMAQRLIAQRASILDGVLGSFNSLRGRVSLHDRDRLDAHAEFVRSLELRSAGSTGMKTLGCARPDETQVPSNNNPSGGVYLRGEMDGALLPFTIENLVQTVACDVSRVASLFFWQSDDPIFPTEFAAGTSPFINNNWHQSIHGTPRMPSGAELAMANNLNSTFNYFAKAFVAVVQRLAMMQDVDGSRLLDNTMVLWMSEMGYGPAHATFNVPIVMAGMKSAFSGGQGRHIVVNRRSLGDFFAELFRMFGGTDTTFGDTGTLGQYNSDNLQTYAGFPGFITKDTPLHFGPIGL